MMAKNDIMQKFIHRTNIVKYEKILATYLTADERRFVERRLAEERAALLQLAGSLSHRESLSHKPSNGMALA